MHDSSTCMSIVTDKIYDIAYKGTDRFACKVDAHPPAQVNWYKNGNILPKDNILVSSDGFVLTIKNMQPMDAGKYMCEIKNINHNKNYPFEIQISGVGTSVTKKQYFKNK